MASWPDRRPAGNGNKVLKSGMKPILPILAFLLLSATALADPAPPGTPQPVPVPSHFAAGTSTGKVSGSVIRADRDLYTIAARAGQKMTVTIKAKEDNAVFQIYQPGAVAERDADDMVNVAGTALPGADGDTSHWTGPLPVDGTYLIEVGGTRGNATYDLTVSVEEAAR